MRYPVKLFASYDDYYWRYYRCLCRLKVGDNVGFFIDVYDNPITAITNNIGFGTIIASKVNGLRKEFVVGIKEPRYGFWRLSGEREYIRRFTNVIDNLNLFQSGWTFKIQADASFLTDLFVSEIHRR
jgi:hypothetical protein